MNKEIIDDILKNPLYKLENNNIFSVNQCMEYVKNNVDPIIYKNYINTHKKHNTLSSKLPADKWGFINNTYYFYPYSLWYAYSKTNIATLLEISKNWYNTLVNILFEHIKLDVINTCKLYDYIVIVPQSINRKYNILINIEKLLENSLFKTIKLINNPYYPAIKNIRKLEDKLTCSLKKFSIDTNTPIKDNANILIIDDVINTWATIVWIASKLKEINPNINIDALWLIASIKNEIIKEI